MNTNMYMKMKVDVNESLAMNMNMNMMLCRAIVYHVVFSHFLLHYPTYWYIELVFVLVLAVILAMLFAAFSCLVISSYHKL